MKKKSLLIILLIMVFQFCTTKNQQEQTDFDHLSLEQKNQIIEKASADLQKDSENPESYFLRGSAYFSTGDYQKAVHDLMNALKYTDDNETKKRVYIELGKSWLQLDKPDSAYLFLRGASVLDYNNTDAHGYMSIAAERIELYQLAYWTAVITENDYQNSEIFSFDSIIALKNNSAKKTKKEIIDPDSIKSDNPLVFENMAYYANFKKKFAVTTELYDKAINLRHKLLDSLDKNSPLFELEQLHIAENYYLRGKSQSDNGNPEEAIRDYTSAIEIYDGNWNFLQNRGFAYYLTHKFEEAIEDYTKAIEIDANNEVSYFQRAIVNYETGNKEQALEDAKVAYKLNPIHPSTESLLKEMQKLN